MVKKEKLISPSEFDYNIDPEIEEVKYSKKYKYPQSNKTIAQFIIDNLQSEKIKKILKEKIKNPEKLKKIDNISKEKKSLHSKCFIATGILFFFLSNFCGKKNKLNAKTDLKLLFAPPVISFSFLFFSNVGIEQYNSFKYKEFLEDIGKDEELIDSIKRDIFDS